MIDLRFDALETRIDARFDGVDGRFDRLDGRVATLESRFDDLTRELRGQTWRLMTLMVAFVGVIVAAVRL